MSSTLFLKLAYVANVVILLPVCWALFSEAGTRTVFEAKVAESEGLRLLVAALYGAILLVSVAGLVAPRFFAPLLLVQVVYKSIWLMVFVWPLYRSAGSAAVPWGITTTFLMIIATYPFLLWLGLRGSSSFQ